MKKLALGLMGTVLVLVVLLIGLLAGVLGTEPGVTWLLGQVQSMAPGAVRVGAHQGHFFGRLELSAVDLNVPTAQINADTVVLDWSPRRLLGGEFLVNQLSVAGLRFAGEPADPPPPSEPLQWPIQLPAVSPPVRVVINRVELHDVELITSPEASPLIIDQALLQAYWGDDGIVVENLTSSGPGYSLAIAGQIDPLDDYATLLENRFSVAPDEGPALALEGRIEGNTEHLQATQQISGDAEIGLSLTLDKPLVEPFWQALVQFHELPGTLLSAELPLTISGEISGSGGLDTAAVSGELRSSSKADALDGLHVLLDAVADGGQQKLTLKRVELRHKDEPLRLALQGTASAEAVAIEGEWSALQWPLTTVKPSVRSERGRLSLRGPLDAYRLEVDADVAAQGIIEGDWALRGKGDRQQLVIERLSGAMLGGTLDTQGAVAWAPQTSWDLRANARGLKPQAWLADPEAVVHVTATTSGRIGDAGPEARVLLQSLGGRLNGQPLTGRGELSYTSERIEIDGLRVNNADALLAADGTISRQSDLTWRLQVPDLGKLVADGGGSVTSQGRVSGARDAPHIVGDITIDSIVLPNLRIDELKGKVDVDLQDRRRSQVDLGARALAVGDNGIERLQLGVDGFIRDHQLTVRAEHAQGTVDLATKGGYEQLWKGSLTRLEIDTQALGAWRLRRPVALTLSPEKVNTELLCLTRERAHLCAQGQWEADGEATGNFDLAALPLPWLQAMFPEQITGASGVLSASGEVTQGRSLQARLQAALTPGEFQVQGAEKEVNIPHQGAKLALNTEGQGVKASLKAGVDKSRLDASASLPDILAVADAQQAKLSANLRLEAPDLEFLPLLVPTISRIDGQVRAKFDVRGEVGKPWIGGGGQLNMPTLDMDHLGLALSDTRLDLGVTNNTLTLDGKTMSGGRLNLQGSVLLDSAKGWPLQVSLKGQDFVAVNVPSLMVSLSPDLKVQRSADAVNVSGTVTVPAAEILVRDLPSGSRSASPDIIIVGEDGVLDGDAEDTAPVDIDITLALGDKVHLAALGLDAFLRGELALRALPGHPLRATGDLRLFDGIFRAYGQRLVIERGLFSFAKSPLDNPGLNVRAVRVISDVEVGVNALGTVKEMIVTTFSSPAMSENDRISYLVTGKPAREGASLSLDRQIAKNLTVGVSVDTDTGDRAFLTRYRLSRTLYSEVSSSARSSALDLFYTVETK